MRTKLRSEQRFQALEDGRLRYCNVDVAMQDGLWRDPPKVSGDIGHAGENQTDLGHRSLNLSREQFEYSKKLGDEQMALTRPIAEEQLGMMKESRARGTDQWNQYLSTFKPVEERMAKEAMEYDSPEEMERRAQQAAGDVTGAFSNARAVQGRELARMGINPNSGKFQSAQDVAADEARITAGAMNTAREGVRDRGIALRSGVAAFGRNQPNMAGQMTGVATGAGTNAVGNMNSTANSMMAAQGTGAQWGGLAQNSYAGAGNTFLGRDGLKLATWKAESDRDMQLLKEETGMAKSAMGMFGSMFASDRKKKRNIKDVSDAEVVEEVKRLPVSRYRYKDGVQDGGDEEHIGPMAQDMAKLGIGDGKQLPVQDMIGLSLAAVKGLAKKVEAMESKMASRGVK